MQTYQDVIESFVSMELPIAPVSKGARFEAVVNEILGTKQRRFGPLPSPEVQVAVRDIVRQSNDSVHFFLPWGSSKQDDGQQIDISELFALKQLYCLQQALDRHAVQAHFHFRVEDLTDRYLFGDKRAPQIFQYLQDFTKIAEGMLGAIKVDVHPESFYTVFGEFQKKADSFVDVFYKYLRGETPVQTLKEIGWTGTIPQEQQDYYYDAYRIFYPFRDHKMELAKYFSATLARVQLGATAAPMLPHILIAFTHPVPGNPVNKARLHYRTMPEKYTNHHKSPWLARSYFEIKEDNTCTPKFATKDTSDVIPNKIKLWDVCIDAPYKLV